MDNSFGEFLYELRKEKGLTQAALAESLGVTNKAVSKWETGEAMPETALLLPISEIFGVTVDELLSGKRKGEESKSEEEKAEKAETIEAQLFKRGKDEPETPLEKVSGAVCAILVFIGCAVYVILGIVANLWHPYWVIIPVCALACGIVGIIFDFCNREKKAKQIAEGKNPIIGGICGIVMLSCIIAYLLVGALANLWHPCWAIVVGGVVVDGILGTVGNIKTAKNK